MSWRMVLGEVVRLIGFARSPVDLKLELIDPVADPVETHVHGAGAALFDRVIGNAFGTFIIGLDGGGRLWMAQFFQGDTDAAGVLGNVE